MGEKKEKENGGAITIVLKSDIHCGGCASKIRNCIRNFDGVDTVTIDDQKITVVGKVDPTKLREKVEQKTHKKVELISPQPKKDGGDKNEKKKENNDQKSDEKSGKEPPMTTAVLKLNLHCQGCVTKIYKIISKTKGYNGVEFDEQKDLVTVTGSMDMKALTEVLQKQLKRDVAIVPPKKEGEKKEKGGGDDKGKSGDENKQENKMQASVPGYPYPYTIGPGPIGGELSHYNPYETQYHAPQIFSDENPNACSVM